MFPELLAAGFDSHYVKEVLIMDHPEPDTWIDVTQEIDTAVEALKAHESQAISRIAAPRIREQRKHTGEQHSMEYAEAFKQFLLRPPR